MIVLSVFAISCGAQETPDDAAMQPIRSLIQQIQDASETQNGLYYASAFVAEATWSGPLGETADPENIQQEANQMFSRYGSLVMREWEVRPLTSDVKIVDIYQMAKPVPPSENSVPAAVGRVGPRLGPNLRTTLIIKNQAGQWKVLAARVADIQNLNDQAR
jgi:hypothetical protein